MPVAHIIARQKYLKNKNKVPEQHSPYKTAPWSGLYTEETNVPLVCQACDVDVTANAEVTKYNIRMTFLVDDHTGRFSFYFPVSDCGHVEKLRVQINGTVMTGEIKRRSRRNSSRLVSSANREEFLQTDSDEDDASRLLQIKLANSGKKMPKREPTVFYFCLQDCPARLFSSENGGQGSAAPGSKVLVEVDVTTNTVERQPQKVYNMIFPLTCVPRTPTSFRCRFYMAKTIRRIVSPNKSHEINPYFNDEQAEVILDISSGNQMLVSDFLFILQVELGEPIQPECIDPMTLFVLATAVGAFVFYMLTKELEYFHS